MNKVDFFVFYFVCFFSVEIFSLNVNSAFLEFVYGKNYFILF